MISRKTSMAIAKAYTDRFSFVSHPSMGRTRETVYQNQFYDFLYEQNYQPWFCNMVKGIYSIRRLKDWLLQIHTGESFFEATPNWTWEQRQDLGQVYLKNLARDFIIWCQSDANDLKYYNEQYDEMVRRLEMDGYVFRDDDLYQNEEEVLDVEAETGLLDKLHTTLGLPDRSQTFQFLQLSEDHYVAGRWSDSIANVRKFFEAILQQVANRHSMAVKGAPLVASTLEHPAAIRSYLETVELLEKKEREAIDKIYGLLSQTGSHPYMAEKDQARLLRQLSLITIQFVMLRLEAALTPKSVS